MVDKLTNTELAKLLVPESTLELSEIELRYPKRKLPEGALVVRVAPSPTGFAHFGLIFTSMVNEQIAHLSSGVFFLRIEDTDKNREVVGGIKTIITALREFGVQYSEGPILGDEEVGQYGPYIQSHRQEVYLSAIKTLLKRGMAYPCFCNAEKLELARQTQVSNKERTGYYGKYAACRNLSLDNIKDKLAAGETFAIRFRSPLNFTVSTFTDSIKGRVTLPGNDTDYVLMKSASTGLGLPVYHLAAMVDDHLQGVNQVIRGDEWLPSLPLHLQIIDAFGWDRPKFGHLSPVMKMDGETTKRKLSKRKDPEADTSYYLKLGIPAKAVRAYVLNIADSGFEKWRKENPHTSLLDFPLTLVHMGSSGALFDMVKFLDICKQEISTMKVDEIYSLVCDWSQKFNSEFHRIFTMDKEYSISILNIEREGDKNRKDISQWSQIPDLFGFFYDEIFDQAVFPITTENITDPLKVKEIIKKFLTSYHYSDTKEIWFEKLKVVCLSLGYASSMKEYKSNTQGYRGHLGDVAMVLRIALSGKTMTPDLYEMMQVMGEERVISRLRNGVTKP